MGRVRVGTQARGALVAGLLAVAVLGAAFAGSWRFVVEPRQVSGVAHPNPTQTVPQLPGGGREVAGERLTLDLSPLRWLAILVVIGCAAWFVRWLLARQTPDTDVADLEMGFELVDPDPETVVSELEAGLAEAAEHLCREGEPADAVVAAWVALQAAALRSGVPRDPAATPTEFAVEVLDRTAADRHATRSLLAAYHRARFSEVPVTDEDVERAAADLRQVAATIRPVEAEQ
jgi:hypothetical protein